VEDPRVPLSSANLSAWLTGNPSGVEVSEATVMGLTAYLRAVELVSGALAMLPIRVYYRGTHRLVTSPTVLDSPSRILTPFEFWQTWVSHQLTWGNAYGFKVRNAAGVVTEIRQIHPSRVTVRLAGGEKVFTIADGDGVNRDYTAFDVAHLLFHSADGLCGLSKLKTFRTVLGSSIAAEQVSDSFYRNGARLSGLVKTKAKLTRQQADELSAQFDAKFGGPANAGRVGVLDSEADYQTLSLPPEDAQVLQTRAFTVEEVARMFGVPSHMLEAKGATSWGSGIEQMQIAFAQFTLGPRVKGIEERITRELLPGGWSDGEWEARYDFKGLLRGDNASRAAFYQQLMNMKVITNRDIAALEDMDPPDDNVFVIQSSYTLVDRDTGTVTNLAQASGGGDPAEVDADELTGDGDGQGLDAPVDDSANAMSVADLTVALQKIYLSIGTVISADEARQILNRAGAGLDVPGPPMAGKGAPALAAAGDATSDDGSEQ
jgi:HK97 family phage portal protein